MMKRTLAVTALAVASTILAMGAASAAPVVPSDNQAYSDKGVGGALDELLKNLGTTLDDLLGDEPGV